MKKNEQLFRIAVASIVENRLENIKYFEGNKREIIDFMNKEYSKRFLSNLRKDNVVFNIVYQNKDELLDVNNWLSLDELESLQIIKCEVE